MDIYIIQHIYLLLINIIALYLFTSGFFLTRYEVKDQSTCTDLAFLNHTNKPIHLNDKNNVHPSLRSIDNNIKLNSNTLNYCWYPKKFKRLVFIVIDALRYDFVYSNKTYLNTSLNYYTNYLTNIQNLLKNRPNNSLLYKFIADPPTMTMQRLKGLTTGTLPTFLDIKENIHSKKIIEDNLLNQFYKNYNNYNRYHTNYTEIIFMGDNTWDLLYSNYFYKNYSFDSFNVKDLHTVDNGIINTIYNILENNNKWGILIAHFLGIDHIGHTYGPNHMEMKKKLIQMNHVILSIINKLDNDTLLVLLGDHGMTEDGNHGGATNDETDTALFLYSHKNLHYESNNNIRNKIPQVDLVPTLSLLLGLPIPFSNVGKIIPELFLKEENSNDINNNNNNNLINALFSNVFQVQRYFHRYAEISGNSAIIHIMKDIDKKYNRIKILKKLLDTNLTINKTIDEEKLNNLMIHLLNEILEIGKRMWTQFNLHSMFLGIILLISGLLTLISFIISTNLFRYYCKYIYNKKYNLIICGGGVICYGLLDEILNITSIQKNYKILTIFIFIYFIFITYICISLLYKQMKTNIKYINNNIFEKRKFFLIFFIILHGISLLSNSYILAQHSVIYFIITSFGMIHVWEAIIIKSNRTKSLFIIFPICFLIMGRTVIEIKKPNIITNIKNYLVCFILLSAIPIFSIILYNQVKKNNIKYPSLQLIVWIIIIFNYINCYIYWYFSPINQMFFRLGIPRFVFILSLISIIKTYNTNIFSIFEKYLFILNLLIPSFLLVSGPSSVRIIVFMLLHFYFFMKSSIINDKFDIIYYSLIWSFLGYYYYFQTGHHNDFAHLQNAAGFVGSDQFYFYYAGILLGYNTFGIFIIVLFCCFPLFLILNINKDNGKLICIKYRKKYGSFVILGFFMINALITTIFVAFQRRHLMVWAIFAPKFIYDIITLIFINTMGIVLPIK